MRLDSLLPEDLSNFWTYYGSLTTPPCSQTVLWTVLTEPLPVSVTTLLHLDQLHDDTQEEHQKSQLNGDEVNQGSWPHLLPTSPFPTYHVIFQSPHLVSELALRRDISH